LLFDQAIRMMTRAFALFFSLLTFVNLVGSSLSPGFDGSSWWFDFGAAPGWLSAGLLALLAVAALLFAIQPPKSLGVTGKVLTPAITGCVGVVALFNAIQFCRLLLAGRISAGFPIPFSLLISFGMFAIARESWPTSHPQPRGRLQPIVAASIGLFALYPLALMLFFWNTNYRRPADVAIVFGARVYKDGRLSDALEDRIRTACALYHDGLVQPIAVSGGAGDGAVTEAAAMHNYAVNHGVRAVDIAIDDGGVNTEATVHNTLPMLRQWHAQRVLVVSHFYHLPRIKLAFQRAGVQVFTVPARQGRLLGQIPFNMAREIAAFWKYYFSAGQTA
jgi:uncharacterized SAM-binding protein YcdF (DUF218 family)